MAKVAAVVITYNRSAMLDECIRALLGQTSPLDIYIIDNHSTDDTKQVVEKYLANKNVFYFDTGENLGGAGGFNYGIKNIADKDYKYCWLMDDDTIPNKDALEAMLDAAQKVKDDFSFLSSVALWTNGELCKMNIQAVSEDAIVNYKSLQNNLLKIDSASFVSCFVKMDCIKKVGLPIKDFFIYGDDMEFTIRLSKVAPCYLNPYSVVTHKMPNNLSINIVDTEKDRIGRYYYNFRNLSYIYRTNDKKEYRIYKLKSHYLVLKVLLKSKSNKLKRIHAIKKGMRAGKRFNPKIEKL